MEFEKPAANLEMPVLSIFKHLWRIGLECMAYKKFSGQICVFGFMAHWLEAEWCKGQVSPFHNRVVPSFKRYEIRCYQRISYMLFFRCSLILVINDVYALFNYSEIGFGSMVSWFIFVWKSNDIRLSWKDKRCFAIELIRGVWPNIVDELILGIGLG